MTDSLTTLIGKIQTILGDDGTIFTTATCTAAVRQALSDFNRAVPQILALTITGINNQLVYELSDEDENAVSILDVLLQGENDADVSITYDAYTEDERIFFRLLHPVTDSDTLLVRYTANHTINGLDSEVESTILAKDDQIIVDGAAYQAVYTRATSRVESINLSKDQSDNYREVASHFKNAFLLGIKNAARRRLPSGEPDSRAWNDIYHHWN